MCCDISEAKAKPLYITVADYGITFPAAVLKCLHYAREVHVFYNDANRVVAIKPCEKDKNSFTLWNPNISTNRYVRWNNSRHRNHIFRLLGVTPSRPGIKLECQYYPEEDLLLFELK